MRRSAANNLTTCSAVCLKECNGHLQQRDRAILAVLAETGIRASELCELTIGNTHLDPERLPLSVFTAKGINGEKSGLEKGPGANSARICACIVWTLCGTEPVFVSRQRKQLLAGGLRHIVYRLGEWAYITGVRCSPHTFRHTFACNYLLQGGDIYVLSRLMGHTSVKITERYLKAIKATEARQTGKRIKSVLE